MDRIYIIESPAPSDLYDGRCEGKALYNALQLAGTDVTYSIAADVTTFKQALSFVVEDFYEKSGKWSAMPILHISAHGDSDGIVLTNGDYFEWDDFREALNEINQKIGYVPHSDQKVSKKISRIVLCFSSCDGYNGYQIHAEDPCPFQSLIGPISAIAWSDSFTAFLVFYHATNYRELPFSDAVGLMNQAVGLDNVFQSYLSPELAGMQNAG